MTASAAGVGFLSSFTGCFLEHCVSSFAEHRDYPGGLLTRWSTGV